MLVAVTASGLCCLGAILLVACPALRPRKNAILTGTLAVCGCGCILIWTLSWAHSVFRQHCCELGRHVLRGFMLAMQDLTQAALRPALDAIVMLLTALQIQGAFRTRKFELRA